jgi:hypothetical protein
MLLPSTLRASVVHAAANPTMHSNGQTATECTHYGKVQALPDPGPSLLDGSPVL